MMVTIKIIGEKKYDHVLYVDGSNTVDVKRDLCNAFGRGLLKQNNVGVLSNTLTGDYEYHQTDLPGQLSTDGVKNSLLDLCKNNEVSLLRNSFLFVEPVENNQIKFSQNKIGDYFIYVERLDAVKKLYDTLLTQYTVSTQCKSKSLQGEKGYEDNWENSKREIKIPITHGLSGIGKSRFAREALIRYIRRLSETDQLSGHASNENFVDHFLNDKLLGNFRIAMDDVIQEDNIQKQLTIEILYQFMKYSLLDKVPENGRHKIKSIIEKSIENFNLLEAIKFIIEKTPFSCILVNIDEASAVSQTILQSILKCFGDLLCLGLPVYFTVSGVYRGPSMENAAISSGMQLVVILLPPLSVDECCFICHKFLDLPESSTENNQFFLHLVWLAGGVPRYLAYLLFFIAKMRNVVSYNENSTWFETKDFPALKNIISNFAHRDAQDVTASWIDLCTFKRTVHDIPSDVYSNLISLCLSEFSVEGQLEKNISQGKQFSIDAARTAEMMFITPQYHIFIPPILLHHYHNSTRSELTCLTLPLIDLCGVMNSRDNEALYITIIVHRIRALMLLGHKKIDLYTLLGVKKKVNQCNYDIDLRDDVSSVNWQKAETTVTKNKPSTAFVFNLGEVNTPTASYADCSINLKLWEVSAGASNNLPIRIQEKQKTLTRRMVFLDGDRAVSKAPKTVHGSDVRKESEKIERNSFFIYITDDQAAKGEEENLERDNSVVITDNERLGAFGNYLGKMKLYCMAPSQVDTK